MNFKIRFRKQSWDLSYSTALISFKNISQKVFVRNSKWNWNDLKHQMPNWQTVDWWTIRHKRKPNTKNNVRNSNLICGKIDKDNAQCSTNNKIPTCCWLDLFNMNWVCVCLCCISCTLYIVQCCCTCSINFDKLSLYKYSFYVAGLCGQMQHYYSISNWISHCRREQTKMRGNFLFCFLVWK